MFGCHSKFSICHVTSYDHVIRGSSDIMGEFLSIISHHSAKFGDNSHSTREEISFLVCHVISGNYADTESSNIMGEFLLS